MQAHKERIESRTSMHPRSFAKAAGSKVLRHTSPQNGKSPQAESENLQLPRLVSLAVAEMKKKKKKAHLRSSIDLCLPSVLPLSQDGGSNQLIPVLFADEVRSLEEDGGAVAPRHSFPSGLGRKGALDCPCYGCLVCLVICADIPGMV